MEPRPHRGFHKTASQYPTLLHLACSPIPWPSQTRPSGLGPLSLQELVEGCVTGSYPCPHPVCLTPRDSSLLLHQTGCAFTLYVSFPLNTSTCCRLLLDPPAPPALTVQAGSPALLPPILHEPFLGPHHCGDEIVRILVGERNGEGFGVELGVFMEAVTTPRGTAPISSGGQCLPFHPTVQSWASEQCLGQWQTANMMVVS